MARVSRAERLRATVRVPGDKSISHRALILNALANGTASIDRILDSEDVRSTAACLEKLGVTIEWPEGSSVAQVHGVGVGGLRESDDILDCGNSGTTMRLLSGLLAGQPFLSVLTGDASLRTRPMARVITPLRSMGVDIRGRAGDSLAPLAIRGGGLRAIAFESPVASAQVKSAVLLAGLYADGTTSVTEPTTSRDHTERMLAEMGAQVSVSGTRVEVRADGELSTLSLRVPGDISSAAPWLVLGACHPDARIVIENVDINPTRTGLLDILRAMGAQVEHAEVRTSGGEPVADLVIETSTLHGTRVSGGLVPRAIDELPLVALLACFAEGETVVADAHELRVKESDRVEAVLRVLEPMGARITPREDGFVVHGACSLHGGVIDAGGDHRIGMLGAIAGALASGTTEVRHDAVGVSYPRFWEDLEAAAAGGVGAV